jgi:hypothetical protein
MRTFRWGSRCGTRRVPIWLLVIWIFVELKAAAQVQRKFQAMLLREQDGSGVVARLTCGIPNT